MNRASLQVIALVLAASISMLVLTACTPKPASAKPVVEEFFAQLTQQEFGNAAQFTDQPPQVTAMLTKSWEGLQAESVNAEILDIDTKETIATATYKLTWNLPKEREFSYETRMVLNKINDQWSIRWQPTALHPTLGANQHLELRAINAQRASVISSDGAEVLVPGSVYRILVDLNQTGDRTGTAHAIAAALEKAKTQHDNVRTIDAAKLAENLNQASGIYSVTTVDKLPGAEVKAQLDGKPGIRFNEEAAMVSTDPTFAPDIISRVAGLVNDSLDGANGWRVAAVTDNGALIDDIVYHEPQVAPAVRISLDHKVQQAAEEAVNLRAEMQAMIVAIKASTGEILAVAQTDKADEQGDVALSGLYPPGSTFKIITAAAGIQDKGLNPGSIVPCPGSMNLYGRTVTNYNGFSLGNVPLQQAFARSCNTTFAEISTHLDKGELKRIGAEFGLGIDYEIPGLSTITGQIPEGETALDKTEAGYGQGLTLVSPFGMALVSATAARGSTPTPTLISGFETKQSAQSPAPRPETIEQLRALMGAVTEPGGTASGIKAGGKIFGKTGEAEINQGSHAWFTGYRDDIAFATLIVLGGGSESAVAITDRFFSRLDELHAPEAP